MPVQIHPVGGYGEVGRNMTAIRVDDEVVICDMGIHVSNYIHLTDHEDLQDISIKQLHEAEAIPDDATIDDWKDNVLAIMPTHAHLDHVAAIPFLAKNYDCPVIATPFTIELLKANLQNEKIQIPNRLQKVNPNAKIRLSKNIEVEFINITHSTPQSVMIAIHTKYGTIIYANDFKFDYTPTLGQKPNINRLKEIGNGKVLAVISECLYANEHIKMPSEAMARDMLREVMYNTDNKNNLIVVTTFSSHIARLKSIIECGKKLNRKILFLGRSMSKYVYAAENANIVNFTKDIELVKYSSKIQKRLKKIAPKDRKKYILVITGHQAEAKATLSKIAYGDLKFKFLPQDQLIFASKVIPTQENIQNYAKLIKKLKTQRIRIFEKIHISGHAGREDLRDLLQMTKPKYIIPSHGEKHMEEGMKSLALEMGYKPNQVKMLVNNQRITLK